MDGYHVPTITSGGKMTAGLGKLVYGVHLMIMDPEHHIKDFADCEQGTALNPGASVPALHKWNAGKILRPLGNAGRELRAESAEAQASA